MRILIAEDETTSQELLRRILDPVGVTQVTADGAEAIAAVASALDEKRPFDILFLDVMMPCVDGVEVVREIRELEERHGISGLSGVKIVMTTSLNDSKTVLNAFRSGCEAYLIKPITADSVMQKLREFSLLNGEP